MKIAIISLQQRRVLLDGWAWNTSVHSGAVIDTHRLQLAVLLRAQVRECKLAPNLLVLGGTGSGCLEKLLQLGHLAAGAKHVANSVDSGNIRRLGALQSEVQQKARRRLSDVERGL